MHLWCRFTWIAARVFLERCYECYSLLGRLWKPEDDQERRNERSPKGRSDCRCRLSGHPSQLNSIWLSIVLMSQNPDLFIKKEWSHRLYTSSAFDVVWHQRVGAPWCQLSYLLNVPFPSQYSNPKAATTESSGKIDSVRATSSPAAAAQWRMRF